MKTKRNAPARPYKSKYSAQNKSYGFGGAVMSGFNSLLNKQPILPSILNAGKAFITPGSGISQGLKLGGTLAGKSNNPSIQKLGQVANLAGNVAGVVGGGGAGGGGIMDMLKGFIPGMSAANGMKVLKSYENGGAIGDPIKPTGQAGVVANYEPTTNSTKSVYTNTEGMQPSTSEGSIPAINKDFDIKTSSFDTLPEDQIEAIMASDFGKTYFSGEGSLDKQYQKYATEVHNFLDTNPEGALDQINRMMESNDNFKTKLKDAKTDQEKLDITRGMMTDGKIGDFHGRILPTEKPQRQPLYGGDEMSNFRGAPLGERVMYGLGNEYINEASQAQYRSALLAAGVDPSDEQASMEFFDQYVKSNPEALGDRSRGSNSRGLDGENIARGEEITSAVTSGQQSGTTTEQEVAQNKKALEVEYQKLMERRGYNRNSSKYAEITATLQALRTQIDSMNYGGKVQLKKKSFDEGGKLREILSNMFNNQRSRSESTYSPDYNFEQLSEEGINNVIDGGGSVRYNQGGLDSGGSTTIRYPGGSKAKYRNTEDGVNFKFRGSRR